MAEEESESEQEEPPRRARSWYIDDEADDTHNFSEQKIDFIFLHGAFFFCSYLPGTKQTKQCERPRLVLRRITAHDTENFVVLTKLFM